MDDNSLSVTHDHSDSKETIAPKESLSKKMRLDTMDSIKKEEDYNLDSEYYIKNEPLEFVSTLNDVNYNENIFESEFEVSNLESFDDFVDLTSTKEKLAKKRSNRVTLHQMEVFLTFLESNRHILINGKLGAIDDSKFEKFCDILNKIPGGSKKSLYEWRRFLTKWKSKTRAKLRTLQTSSKQYDHTMRQSELTNIEERLMNLVGYGTADGVIEVPPDGDDVGVLRKDKKPDVDNEQETPRRLDNLQSAKCIADNDQKPKSKSKKIEKTYCKDINERMESIENSSSEDLNWSTEEVEESELISTAKVFLKASENILKASEILAASINNHASALNKCAGMLKSWAERKKT